MRFSRALVRGLLCGASLAPSGCGLIGGQTGEGDETGPSCTDDEARVVGLNDATPLGFTAAEVFAFASEVPAFAATWGASDATGSLRITPRTNEARYIGSSLDRELEGGDPCRGRLEVAVVVELELSDPDGALGGSFDAVLVADSPSLARIATSVAPSALVGASRADLTAAETLREFSFNAVLSPSGTAGVLTAVAEHTEQPSGPTTPPKGGAPRAGPSTVERAIDLAVWPTASPCAPGELPVPLDATLLEVNPEELVRRLDAESVVTWDGGNPTTAHFRAAAAAEAACLPRSGCPEWCAPVDYPPVEPQDRELLGIPVQLSVDTDDSRWRGRIDTTLQAALSKDGGVLGVWINHSGRYASAQEVADRAGFSPIALPEGAEAIFSLVLRLDDSGPNGVVSLDTLAPESAECDTTPCAGTPQLTPLVRGIVGNGLR